MYKPKENLIDSLNHLNNINIFADLIDILNFRPAVIKSDILHIFYKANMVMAKIKGIFGILGWPIYEVYENF